MASLKRLESRKDYLNKIYGFKGFKYVRVKSTGKLKRAGTGFQIGQAYGGVRLEFQGKRGVRDVSPRLSKAKLDEYIGAMIRGVDFWKDRAKLK
tara:strand:+ start:544 stop:825 length:282 start_codon:yes stop_codon:yes gene_type:complete